MIGLAYFLDLVVESYAIVNAALNTTWPFVKNPVHNILIGNLDFVDLAVTCPLVQSEQKAAWEAFSKSSIYRYGENGIPMVQGVSPTIVGGQSVYCPAWDQSKFFMNLDLLSIPEIANALDGRNAELIPIQPFKVPFIEFEPLGLAPGARSWLIHPVYDRGATGTPQRLVGLTIGLTQEPDIDFEASLETFLTDSLRRVILDDFQNQTFPFVTNPLFPLLADRLIRDAGLKQVFYCPVVSANNKDSWELYTRVRYDSWLPSAPTTTFIYRMEENGSVVSDSSAGTQFCPIWHHYPAEPVLVNYNAFSANELNPITVNRLFESQGVTMEFPTGSDFLLAPNNIVTVMGVGQVGILLTAKSQALALASPTSSPTFISQSTAPSTQPPQAATLSPETELPITTMPKTGAPTNNPAHLETNILPRFPSSVPSTRAPFGSPSIGVPTADNLSSPSDHISSLSPSLQLPTMVVDHSSHGTKSSSPSLHPVSVAPYQAPASSSCSFHPFVSSAIMVVASCVFSHS